MSIALGRAFPDLEGASVDLGKILTVLMGVSGDSTVLLAEFDLDWGVLSFKAFRLDCSTAGSFLENHEKMLLDVDGRVVLDGSDESKD
jgi:hypothetical protein